MNVKAPYSTHSLYDYVPVGWVSDAGIQLRHEYQNLYSFRVCNIICNNNNKSNLYIAPFDTNGILTALYIVITYIQMQYVHI